MKRILIVLPFILLVSCGGGKPDVKMGVLPNGHQLIDEKFDALEKKLQKDSSFAAQNSLNLNCQYFRINQIKYKKIPYTVKNHDYFAALSNEFSMISIDKPKSLTAAIAGYLALMKTVPDQSAYLLQRTGVCYFKLGNMQQANKYINQSIMTGKPDSETYYYKTLLFINHTKEYDKAMKYAEKINPAEVFIPSAEIECMKAMIAEKTGDMRKSMEYYEKAWKADPGWFYTRYNLVDLYLSLGEKQRAQVFADAAFEYLLSLKTAPYTSLAYLNYTHYNKLVGMETMEYSFGLPPEYDTANNIHYYSPNATYLIERVQSADLKIPLKETKVGIAKNIFWATKERTIDFGNNSGMLLTMGNVIITNIRWEDEFLDFYYFPKRYFMSPVALLITPTNSYYVSTNFSKEPGVKGYISTNISNQIAMLKLPFSCYLDDVLFDVDNDKNWDGVYFGYNPTNDVMMTIFYPALNKSETFKLPVTVHNAKVVIQDFNHDGKNEIVLIDKEAVLLKPVPMP